MAVGGPPDRGPVLGGGLEPGTDLRPPQEGEGHVDVTGFLPSLPPSLPSSISACSSLLFPCLSHPLCFPALAHPVSVACGFWGHPILLPSPLLAWSCLLSRCLPQEVGTLPVLAARPDIRGGGCPGLGPTGGGWGLGLWGGPHRADRQTGLESMQPHAGGGRAPGAQKPPVPACLSSHTLLCPRPRQPRLPCARSASQSPPCPPRGPVPLLSPGPLPPLPFQGAG